MLNRGRNIFGTCVELCSALPAVLATEVSGRALVSSLAPLVRRGDCGSAATGNRVGYDGVGVGDHAGGDGGRGPGWWDAARSVPDCAIIFLMDLAQTAAGFCANTPNGVGGYWHKYPLSTPRENLGGAIGWNVAVG